MASTRDDTAGETEPEAPDLSALHEELEDLPKGVRQRLEAFIPELVKKTVTAGMGAVFTTEEGIRRLTREVNLPKDVATYLVNTASTTKDELLRIVAREIREFLQTVQLSEELAKVLTMVSLEVNTSIRFVPAENPQAGEASVEPDVSSDVKLRRGEGRRRWRSRRSRGESGGEPDGEAEGEDGEGETGKSHSPPGGAR